MTFVPVRMKTSVAMIGLLGLLVFAGCSAEARTDGNTHESSSCLPPSFGFSAPRPPLPKALSTPLDATVMSSFAIFRRSRLPSDTPPRLDPTAGGLDHLLYRDYELSSYYPAYVRQPTGFAGSERYFVIPAFGRPEAVPPAHCFPAGVHRELVEQQHRRLVEPVYCIVKAGSNGQAPVPGCEPFAQVDESSRAFQVSDFLGGESTLELVPDGVASVRITYPAIAPVIARVSENAFVLIPPPTPNSRLDTELRRLVHKLFEKHLTKTQRLRVTSQYNKAYEGTYPTRIEWLDSGGRLIRILSRPTAKSDSTASVGDLRAPLEG